MAQTAEEKAAAKAAKDAEKAAAKAAKDAEKAAAKEAGSSASAEPKTKKGFQVLDGNGKQYRVVEDEAEARELAKAIQGRVA